MTNTRWRPAKFAWHFRKKEPVPQIDRWGGVLRGERSFAYQLVTALARSKRWRKVFGIPAGLGSWTAPSLAAREERIAAMRRTRLGRWIPRGAEAPGRPEAPDGVDLPRIRPVVDREISHALHVVSSMAFQELQRRGWHLQPNHYYWPLNDLAFLRENPQLWTQPTFPSEVDRALDDQVELVRSLEEFGRELLSQRDRVATGPGGLAWGENFSGLDAFAYYGLVRKLQPRRVVEVGIGNSSTLLARAVAANQRDSQVTLIDPNPRWEILGQLPEEWKIITDLVQQVDLDVFSHLGPGDILFYDGSHCVRTGSDVNWIFFEVLPRLAPGVWIHIHDIHFPRDYSEEWILDEGLSWNEQYLVQAFLMDNPAYRIRFGSVMLNHYRGDVLQDLLPRNMGNASSLWLEKVV